MLTYWFYPNPGNVHYDSPKVLVIFAVCLLLFVGSFFVAMWRKKQTNSVTRKLSRNWAGRMRIFAYVGIFLVICRVEGIQFFATRILWLVWGLALLGYIAFHVWYWKKKHYTVVTQEKVEDPREKYLPQ